MIEHGSSNAEINRNGHIATIDKPTGTFSMYYAPHIGHDLDPTRINDDVDGVFFEYSTDYVTDPMDTFRTFYNSGSLYGDVIYDSLDRDKSLYFHDVDVKYALPTIYAQEGIIIAEALAGYSLLENSSKKFHSTTVSRRKLLQLGVGAVGAWLTTPSLSDFGRLSAAYIEPLEEPTARLSKSSHNLHPEQTPVTIVFRDLIMAYKKEWLALQQAAKPHYLSILGSSHVEIERQFEVSQEEKLARLMSLKKNVLSPFGVTFGNEATLYSIVKFSRINKSLDIDEIYEVPELKELFLE